MIVRIGNAVYDSKQTPVIIKLTPEEKEQISDMGLNTIFVSAPRHYSEKQIDVLVERTRELIKVRL